MTKAVDMRRKKEDPIGQGTLTYGETLALWGISRKLQDRVFLVHLFLKKKPQMPGPLLIQSTAIPLPPRHLPSHSFMNRYRVEGASASP